MLSFSIRNSQMIILVFSYYLGTYTFARAHDNSNCLFLTPVKNNELYNFLVALNFNKALGLVGISAEVIYIIAQVLISVQSIYIGEAAAGRHFMFPPKSNKMSVVADVSKMLTENPKQQLLLSTFVRHSIPYLTQTCCAKSNGLESVS